MRLAVYFQDGFWWVLQYNSITGECLGKIGPFRSCSLTKEDSSD